MTEQPTRSEPPKAIIHQHHHLITEKIQIIKHLFSIILKENDVCFVELHNRIMTLEKSSKKIETVLITYNLKSNRNKWVNRCGDYPFYRRKPPIYQFEQV